MSLQLPGLCGHGMPRRADLDGYEYATKGPRPVWPWRVFYARRRQVDRSGHGRRGSQYESDYCMAIGVPRVGCPFRYMNHSCHPNCANWNWKSNATTARRPGTLGRSAVGDPARRPVDHRLRLAGGICHSLSLREPRLPRVDRGGRRSRPAPLQQPPAHGKARSPTVERIFFCAVSHLLLAPGGLESRLGVAVAPSSAPQVRGSRTAF